MRYFTQAQKGTTSDGFGGVTGLETPSVGWDSDPF
jgi:hypothetical protein